ncbi:MAG TPA: hypothetical protein VEG39_09185 [Clostridia bacterium]|nr:hypothetical protein [Clostridia bacterium]
MSSKSFKYYFVNRGSTLVEKDGSYIMNKEKLSLDTTIVLDVGNNLKEGIIDHHQIEKTGTDASFPGSTTGMVSMCPRYIYEHLSKEVDEYNIVVHFSPDFDCMAAAYLTQYYINNGKMPVYYELLVDYAEELDSGRLYINKGFLREPFIAVYAFPETVCQSLSDKNNSEDEAVEYGKLSGVGKKQEAGELLNTCIMKRGVSYVEYLMNQLEKLPEHCRNFHNPSLLREDNPFKAEFEYAQRDYQIYVKERDNKDICKKYKLRLPQNDSTVLSAEKIDALFWYSIPECKLHRYWAKQDMEAPGGQGFTMTFIPKYGRQLRGVDLTRVIISVDPGKSYTLKGMGRILELAELKKEKHMNLPETLVRKEGKRKGYEHEPWCFNEDPWYDGKNHGYTIVETPNRKSVLTINEIAGLVLKCFVPEIMNAEVSVIVPFWYDIEHTSFEKFNEAIQRSGKFAINNKLLSQERINSFFPYIQKYYFGRYESTSDKLDNKLRSHHYELKDSVEIEYRQQVDTVAMGVEVELSFYQYGVGYICITLKNDEINKCGMDRFDEFLAFQHDIHEYIYGSRIIGMVKEIINSRIDVFKPVTYSAVRISDSIYTRADKQEMAFKLCNVMDWDDYYSCDDHRDRKTSIEISDYAVCSFSQKGGGLILSDSNRFGEDVSELSNKIWDRFRTMDLDIFLLAYHQRLSLTRFSDKLADYSRDKKRGKNGFFYFGGDCKKKIRSLRSHFVDFSMQGYFSQITRDQVGTRIFECWNEVLQNKQLYEEVDKQLETMDEYNKAQVSRLIELFTLLGMPLAFLTSFATVSIVEVSGTMEISWQLFLLALTGIYAVIILIKNKLF